jgi:hypothetical protein
MMRPLDTFSSFPQILIALFPDFSMPEEMAITIAAKGIHRALFGTIPSAVNRKTRLRVRVR